MPGKRCLRSSASRAAKSWLWTRRADEGSEDVLGRYLESLMYYYLEAIRSIQESTTFDVGDLS